MKVLFFISSLQNGGAERAMSNITTHLPKDVEADILVNSVSENDYPTNANVISLGMKANVKKNYLYQIKALLKRIPKLYQLKKSGQYDACISFMDSANICNILTGNKHCKTIVSVRVKLAQDKSFTYQHIVKPLASLLYNKANYVVAVSEGIKKELINNFSIDASKVVTITNGYDMKVIQEQMEQPTDLLRSNNLDNKFIFVSSGRYSYQKGQWHLIRAFKKVAERCPDAVLLLMGQGPDREYLQKIIEQNNLQQQVILLRYQKNPFAILAQCKVFVMPSLFEGYCNALCEALVCGLPCIATDFQSSAREILAPDTDIEYQLQEGIEKAAYGILTPVCSGVKYKGKEPLEKNELYLAEAMIEMYENHELLSKYRECAQARGKELKIEAKVQEWMALAKS